MRFLPADKSTILKEQATSAHSLIASMISTCFLSVSHFEWPIFQQRKYKKGKSFVIDGFYPQREPVLSFAFLTHSLPAVIFLSF